MTIIEIENTFKAFSEQLETLKNQYTNQQMTDKISQLMTETQVTKLKIMRLNSENEKNNTELSALVSQHINHLHQQIINLKKSFEITSFNA